MIEDKVGGRGHEYLLLLLSWKLLAGWLVFFGGGWKIA